MKRPDLVGAAGVAVMAMSSIAHAYEFRVRWIERVGNVDTPLSELGGSFYLTDATRSPHRLRLQIGVFDDGVSAAPGGGVLGWNVGRIDVSGPPSNSIERRTLGRISPFTFATQSGANGNPPMPGSGDVDFQTLTDIDATLGTQSPFWGCGEIFIPEPQPAPVIRGRNTFVSIYEITTQLTGSLDAVITASGNLIAASEWRTIGTPTPPDCSDPQNPVPGAVTYAPFPMAPEVFSATVVNVDIPGPGWVGVVGCVCLRRRRIRR